MFIQAFTWPAAVIVIAAMFRGEVRQLLERLVRLKVLDIEAQFARDLRESEDLATGTVVSPHREFGTSVEPRRVIHELDGPARPISRSSPRPPRDVIEEGWDALALSADRAAGTAGGDPSRTLIERGVLDAPSVLLFERLRQIHQLVAREDQWEPGADAAVRYADLARALAARIGLAAPRSF
jgi:hypothetical protein